MDEVDVIPPLNKGKEKARETPPPPSQPLVVNPRDLQMSFFDIEIPQSPSRPFQSTGAGDIGRMSTKFPMFTANFDGLVQNRSTNGNNRLYQLEGNKMWMFQLK